MKTSIGFLAAMAMLVAGPVMAQKAPGAEADSHARAESVFPDQNGPLSAALVIIPVAQLSEFDKPSDQGPEITPVKTAKVGDVVAIKILFIGAQGDAKGLVDVTFDIKVTQPDGQIYSDTDEKGLVALPPVPADDTAVFDNRVTVVALRFEDKDARGAYTVTATLHDNVAKRDIPLTAVINLAS